MLNRVLLIGRLAQDPETKYTPTGVQVARFGLAVQRPYASKGGERQTDFINVVAYRQRAEFCSRYLAKGRMVFVEGTLQVRSYVPPDGVRRMVYEVVADNVQFAGPRPEAAPGEKPAAEPAETWPAEEPPSQEPPQPELPEEDVFGDM